MKYYSLRGEYEPKVIGVRNGIYQLEIKEKGFKNKEEYKKIIDFFMLGGYWKTPDRIPEFEVKIEYAQLLKTAKITNFLCFSPALIGCEFMIDEQVKNVFDKFKLQKHFFYPVNLYKGNGEILEMKYYMMYMPPLDFNIINFNESLVYSGSRLLGTKKIHKVNSKEEYDIFKFNNPLGGFERIVLSDLFDKTLDYFHPPIAKEYISEPLKNAIEKEGFTGIRIRESFEPEIIVDDPQLAQD